MESVEKLIRHCNFDLFPLLLEPQTPFRAWNNGQTDVLLNFPTQNSLVKAYEDLNEYLKNEDELKAEPDFVAAMEVLQAAKIKIDSNWINTAQHFNHHSEFFFITNAS